MRLSKAVLPHVTGILPFGKFSLQFGTWKAIFPDGNGHEKWACGLSWGGGKESSSLFLLSDQVQKLFKNL